jgi:hypothetical protein
MLRPSELCDGTRTGSARPKDARRAGFFSLDGKCRGHPGRLLVRLDVADDEVQKSLFFGSKGGDDLT